MKKKLLPAVCLGFVILTYAFAGHIRAAATRAAILQMTNEQVTSEIEALRLRIIPPEGTPLRDVEAVYGPTRASDPSKVIKGDRFVRHWLHLLPGTDTGFRAILIMREERGKKFQNGINHVCVTKNRPVFAPTDTERLEKQILEIQKENRYVLQDLREIEQRFAGKLKLASWNRAKREAGSAHH